MIISGVILSLFLCCHNKNDDPQLLIYIQSEDGQLRELISDKDICRYNWTEQRIFVCPDYNETLINTPIDSSDVFKMVFKNDTVCEGIFVDAALSFFNISKPIIYLANNYLHLDIETNSFRIYDYKNKPFIPVINNDALVQYLKKANLF